MLKQNEKIVLTGKEAFDALKEIEFILISLHKMGSYHAEKPGALEEYRKATTDFIDDCAVTRGLAKVHGIISQHFDDSLGDDDMDDIERYVSDLKLWKHGKPLNRTNQNTEQINISKGTIQQATCKRNELLVFFTNQQNEILLITFHNHTAFQGMNAVGTEIDGMKEEKDYSLPVKEKRDITKQTERSYCFKAVNSGKNIFTVTADSYSAERI